MRFGSLAYKMLRMFRKLSISLIVVAVAVGCGGGGGGGTSVPSPFAGAWQGSWDSPELFNDGTASVTVGTSGNFTGSIHDNGSDADGTVSGTVHSNGALNATVHYTGAPNSSLSGTVTINGSGHFVGTLTQDFGGGDTTAVNFDLAPA